MTKQESIISKNVQKRMKDLGIRNKVELSERSGVSRTVVTNIINLPNKSVMIDSAIKLAKTLDCRVEWLCADEGPMNDECLEKQFRIGQGVPLIDISKLATDDVANILMNVREDESVERIPCPAGNNSSTFVVSLSSVSYRAMLGHYEQSGMLFFDNKANPVSGQWVLVRMSPGTRPEIMEYISFQGKQFLKTLEADIPEEMQRIELSDEMQILATKVSYAVNK